MSDAKTNVGVDPAVSKVVRRPSRLRALAEVEANVESSAEALDRIARVACRVLDVPVALVNLVGADRQRFVGCGGRREPWASMRDLPVTHGFCPFALGADDAYALVDARTDSTLAADPAVQELGVVAYAGVPLRSTDGEPIGTLCAIDYEPHTWSSADLTVLADLAASAVAELRLLGLAARHRACLRALAALSSAPVLGATGGEGVDELARAVDRIDASSIWLLLPDESGQTLRTTATHGADSEAVARHAQVPLDAALPLADVVRAGQPDFLMTRADVRDRLAPVLEVMPDVGSVAVLPLVADAQVLGALGVGFVGERAISTDDREYLAAVAGILSLALARERR